MNKLNKVFLIIILILVIALIFITYKMIYWKNGCLTIGNEFYKSNERIQKIEDEYNRSMDNVKIEVNKDTLTPNGATITITDNNEYPYTYREDFYIKSKQDNGDFKDLELLTNVDFNQTPYKLDENNQIKQTLDWSKLYGTLAKGTYKIVKYVYTANSEIYFESNEFIIE